MITGPATVSPPRQIAASVWLPAFLLFGSGFCALVYQVLWLRLLGLVFGVTVHAAGTVLAAFMGGLAIGSFVAGRLADRVTTPLRWFAAAELLIGAAAVCTPWMLDALEVLYRQVYSNVSDDTGVLTTVRFAGSLAALLVPTTLMGASVPLIIRACVRGPAELGTRAAALYAANAAGALSGALITGYYLVSQLGIAASLRLAAVINVLVGVIAWAWPTRPATATSLTTHGGDATAHRAALSTRGRHLVLAACAVSGFVGLALEIIWFRALVMFLAATTYVFTLILAIVLGGIATGSALATRWLRRDRDWIRRLAILQIAIAVTAVASLAAQAWTFSRGWRTGAALQASALSVLPTMLLMGVAFPIALYCWTAGRGDSDTHTGDRVGRFYL
jgi:MFS family permease